MNHPSNYFISLPPESSNLVRLHDKVPHYESVKFPGKLQVWGVMSYRALSELNIIPPGQTVTTEYYIEEILKKTLTSVMHRKSVTGSVLEKKMLPDMSKAIFQQDGASAHTSKKCQEWHKNNVCKFWEKSIWPANSPDLRPIENLWGILQTRLETMERPTNLIMLQKQLIQAWREITPETIDKLIAGMPNRINKCIQLKGGYIGK
ncbi:hypothetical protein LOD99_11883 [Oopsacas minuta]|uniref:Tc1-like transposase DDE domain-containing protein n=1 Tax=Oopsacas minuta TaxID=111878 RepID=A0AAV7JL39_9METZ|nr:hypothetical protein LOD99_11883 [Oopsacas minuta]